MPHTRRRWIISTAATGLAGSLAAQTPEQQPPLDHDMVVQFVSKSHGDFDTVRALAKREPMLLRASRDGGGGDWETGLGAASHMGRRDIAQFLIDSGARVNIFAVFMLGETAAAKALLAAFPDIHQTPGPHGIPLLSHTIVGKAHALDAFHLLLESGADIDQPAWRGTTPLMQAALSRQAEMVRALLDRGADKTAKTPRGMTALDFAVKRDEPNIIELLRG